MMAQNPWEGTYTWVITNFSRRETERKIYSQVFTIGGCKWRILIFPKGKTVDHLSIYLCVADDAFLPRGWSRDTSFTLTLVNQCNPVHSTSIETECVFHSEEREWGFISFKPLLEFRDSSKGYLVNDTVIVEAAVMVHSVVPSVLGLIETLHPPPPPPPFLFEADQVAPPNENEVPAGETNRFDIFFSSLEKLISNAEEMSAVVNGGPSCSNPETIGLESEGPCLEEVNRAKQSLKECLSDLFKLNIKDRLGAAVKTLSRAKCGLSSDQQKVIQSFWANFDDFISDFLIFEQDNSDFELQRMEKAQLLSAIMKNHETHLSNKQSLDNISKEEEELKKKMEEVKSRKEKLMSDWEELMIESVQVKSKYMARQKKLREAEEKKRIAEERMSRSTAAWSSLKEQFL